MTWPTPHQHTAGRETAEMAAPRCRRWPRGLPGAAAAGKGEAARRLQWLQPGGITEERALSRALAAAGWA